MSHSFATYGGIATLAIRPSTTTAVARSPRWAPRAATASRSRRHRVCGTDRQRPPPGYRDRMRRTIFHEQHDQFRSSVRRFVAKEVQPSVAEWEAAGIVSRDLFLAAGASGF